MPSNIEIKARVADLQGLLARVRALSEDDPPQLIHQDDTFFHTPHGRLKLRVFGDGSGELIHYQRADDSGPKRSDYLLSPVAEPAGMRELLARACGVLGRVRKERILVLVEAAQARVHLDRVDGLGEFIEVEVMLRDGQSEAEGQRLAEGLLAGLGVSPREWQRGAYIDLLRAAEASGAHAQGWQALQGGHAP